MLNENLILTALH